MAKDKLTESAVKEARPAARQFKLSDGGGYICWFIQTAQNTGGLTFGMMANRNHLL